MHHDNSDLTDEPENLLVSRHRSRAVLTKEKASKIFCQRGLVFFGKNGKFSQNSSKILALEYGVSPKTIRDIWNGRTWNHATAGLRRFQEQMAREVTSHHIS
jgi:hypothetical protein